MTRVRTCITYEILGECLRLPPGAKVLGAPSLILAEIFGSTPPATLVLDLDLPDAPEGAASAQPVYSRRDGIPDPVTLEGVWWYREDGTLIADEVQA